MYAYKGRRKYSNEGHCTKKRLSYTNVKRICIKETYRIVIKDPKQIEHPNIQIPSHTEQRSFPFPLEEDIVILKTMK